MTRPGRPIEPGSIRHEARRRGVSEYQIRKERTLAEQGQMVCPTCMGKGTVPEKLREDGSSTAYKSDTGPTNTTGARRCDGCGRFFSERTSKEHQVCYRLLAEQESGYHPLYGVVQGKGGER